jgi:thiamine biosynthesis protein ThiS
MQEVHVVRIMVNGEERNVADGTTVGALLAELNVRTKAVAVERNLQIVPKAEHASCRLCDGDRLEIVTLVGGG